MGALCFVRRDPGFSLFALTLMQICVIVTFEKGETGKRIQVTLAQNILEKLDALCEEKGMRRSALISLALDKYWKEEKADD